MKKILTIFVFVWLALIPNAAKADIVFGADVYRAFIDTTQEIEPYTEDNYDMIAAVLGFDFNGISVESFYRTSEDVSNNNNIDSKLQAYGADFVLRLPTSEYLDFVGSVGYVKYKMETKIKDYESDGLRIGLGFQFNFSKYIGVRAMYHYAALDEEIDEIKSINEVSAGIRIKF